MTKMILSGGIPLLFLNILLPLLWVATTVTSFVVVVPVVDVVVGPGSLRRGNNGISSNCYYLPQRSLVTTTNNVVVLKLSSSSDDEEESTSMTEEERMAAVRKLQKSFYSSPTSSTTMTAPLPFEEEGIPGSSRTGDGAETKLDTSTGILKNLPLWRVGWVEVPGRTNALNVHEGQYTHMFETILNSGSKPWYVGHLHLPGGFKMTRTGDERFLLKNWKDEISGGSQQQPRSAVVGCLMEITDYRRLQDGRLCLLVQTLERFVVDKVIQEFPYSIADVQILPDQEELLLQSSQDGSTTTMMDENFCQFVRGRAVTQSFQYHPYEFYPNKLPVSTQQEYTSTRSINPAAIGKLLPFATYSLDESLLDNITDITPTTSEEKQQSLKDDDAEEEELEQASSFSGGSPPLEQQLQRGNILQNPPLLLSSTSTKKKGIDLKGLETLIWLAIEELVQKTGFVLPAEILMLQQPHMDYLDLAPTSVVDFVHVEDSTPRLSAKYPAYRRQKRLSYTLPAIIEDVPNIGSISGLAMRQAYLNTPSTKARLEAVLQRFEIINASFNNNEEEEKS